MKVKRITSNRVFVGPQNTVAIAKSVANSLNEAGIYARSFSFGSDFRDYSADYNISLLWGKSKRKTWQKIFINRISKKIVNFFIRTGLLIFALIKYDTFIFISPHTFFRSNADLNILKIFRKKVALLLIGCADRNPIDKINTSFDGVCSKCIDYNKRKQLNCDIQNKKGSRIRKLGKYSKFIFAVEDLMGYLPNRRFSEFYIISDSPTEEISIDNKFSDNRVVISHFPSNPLLKGTNHVTKAINRIKEIYGNKVEYRSERKPNNEVLEILETKSHILIDQFYSYHGLLAVEAMARGNVVIARIPDWFKKNRPDLPIVSCEVDEIEDTLIDLIDNPKKMKRIAEESIKYYKKYHSPIVVGNYFKKVMDLS